MKKSKTSLTDANQPRRTKRGLHTDPDTAIYADALRAARELMRRHRELYNTDRHRFRALVKKAQGRVFRLRPGPKADARIAQAAWELARGANLKDLFPKYIDGFTSMSEFTRALAQEGFRKKVNSYMQRHPRLKRSWANKTRAGNGKPNRPP